MDSRLRQVSLFEIELLSELGQHHSLRSLCRAKRMKPPHLSKVLARMEAKLKANVLHRSPKGFVLTPDGIRLVKWARTLIESTEGISKLEHEEAGEEVPLITIAASRLVTTALIAPSIHALKEGVSRLRFRLLDMAPDEIERAALKAACDAIVTLGEPTLTRAWETSRFGTIDWGLFASQKHPSPAVTTEGKILSYPFLVPTYWTGDGYETGEDQCPLSWSDRLRGDESASILVALELLRKSETQVVFAPRLAMRELLTTKEVREIQVKGWKKVELPICLAVRASVVTKKLQTRLVRVFSDYLR